MTTKTIPFTQTHEQDFQPEQVLPIVGAHFVHDIYTAYLAPLLPVLIEKLSLSLTQAGSLSAILQIPAVFNPFIGYLADKVSLRYFVILAPAVTATLMSSLGLAPNFLTLALLLFATGVSVACFHAPAPAMIGRVSGKKIGLGMSLFMAGGELGRTVGPILAVWAVSMWTLEGIYRLMFVGWATSLVLFLRLRYVSARTEVPGSLISAIPVLRSLFLPLVFINFFRLFMLVSLGTYLPTFMSLEGASLWMAGGALSLLELAGVAGALASGTISDRLGRKRVLLVATIASILLMFLFLQVTGWLLVPVLLGLGFTALSTAPVMLAMVQDHLPNNRAVGNGLFIMINFLLRSLIILIIGMLGDRFGLRPTFFWSALLSLAAIPAILALPGRPVTRSK